MADIHQSIFLLGATGYLGSQLLVLLSASSINYHVVALVRAANQEKEEKLKSIHHNLSVVKGSLDDHEIITEQASKAKYVINCASSDHPGSIKAILEGLEKQSANRPGDPPVYIHVSGLALLNDNARGELVPEDQIPRYTDIGFSLDQVPDDAPHKNCDSLIVAAGTRRQNPVRTVIAYPGWIFGVGEGIKKSTRAIDLFLNTWKPIRYAGTWGPGHNSMNNIHVKDAANALLLILQAAIDGKADEGAEGFYFLAGDEPNVTFHDIATVMGDMMFEKGVHIKGGSEALPTSITEPYGEFFWKLFAANHRAVPQRLKRLGWKATETSKLPLLESLPKEVEAVLRQAQ
ncbi:Oxidase ucsJ [Psilocybe cubensis]|uniref:Oxidase ucsJ n=1 Tax=Psilocybe cubensis TaxID=181762 RepID=A0ACB8H628_PSICU|nr:Oxidase ucsJ [Psilocybe cubensis]KAH9483165.1 Oxidase ucsJ [Psilocybe cubensis]